MRENDTKEKWVLKYQTPSNGQSKSKQEKKTYNQRRETNIINVMITNHGPCASGVFAVLSSLFSLFDFFVCI